MKRAVLYKIKDLALEDVLKPDCPDDGLLVKIKVCAVCATDVKIYNYGHRLIQLPRVLGHEVSGTIEAVGEKLKNRFGIGQRVAVCAVVNCCECRYCQRGIPSMCTNLKAFGYHFDGGYQEYMVVPNEAIRCGGVNLLSDNITFEQASIAELLACCINGQRLSNFKLGQSVLIIGSGPVGILHAQLARNQGASNIYIADVIPDKLQQAKTICGDTLEGTLNSSDKEMFIQQVKQVSGGLGFDQIMICCSAPVAQQVSLECVAKSGCINFFGGLPQGKSEVLLDTNHIHYKQCRVVGTHGSSAEDNRIALDMIANNRIDVDPLISDTIGLEQLEDALLINEKNSNRLKTIVKFQ
jgi:L-iditol 2-dehydrogenase